MITCFLSPAAEFEIVHTPPFAESITEGDVRWEKGELDSLFALM